MPSQNAITDQPAQQLVNQLTDVSLEEIRTYVKQAEQELEERFQAGEEPEGLLQLRTDTVDTVLRARWQHHIGEEPGLGLFAAGGYGRAELLPGSDVDIMVLLRQKESNRQADKLQQFLTELWDIGLEVGHSVRTLEDCDREARDDASVITNLLESRCLIGDALLTEELAQCISTENMWSSEEFFTAKMAEQDLRHRKFDNTAYNLEPNVKEGPGGLRDMQSIAWMTKRHFQVKTLKALVGESFITEKEYKRLADAQNFLWKVRIALHLIAGRREDRLLFEYQPKVATALGYSDQSHNLAVERFMQDYFRTLWLMGRLNELLLQSLRESVFLKTEVQPKPLNENFQTYDGYLEARDPQLFIEQPIALLELFYVMAMHPEITGVRASTIRLVRNSRHRINDEFRSSSEARRMFMRIMKAPQGQEKALHRMNRYGILARYIPAFGKIVGLMQFDMFHAYTVDQHTLFVFRNAIRLVAPAHSDELPHASELAQKLPKPWLLYLAGLFHDIGKGRGGDHSELGAHDAREFCLQHGLNKKSSELVAWLVQSHLKMSFISQKRDISDPEVVAEFAQVVGTEERLQLLYLLTICDMRGTNPKLWNSWKGSLLIQLYESTMKQLKHGSENPFTEEMLVEQTRREASELSKLDEQTVNALWQHFDSDYFRRHSAEEVAWHTACINAESRNGVTALPVVAVDIIDGRYRALVYMSDRDFLFGQLTAVLDQMGLNIEEAKLSDCGGGLTLNSFALTDSILGYDNLSERAEEIRSRLVDSASGRPLAQMPTPRRVPRQLKAFDTVTSVNFVEEGGFTLLELVSSDTPGMLAKVGQAFAESGATINTALINTIGERAEDTFYLLNEEGNPLSEAEQNALESALVQRLDND